MDAEAQLSRRERQIMDIVYGRGKATAGDVLEDLPDRPTRTTVRTLLRILETKGLLTHVTEGREYVYRPTRAKAKVGRSALNRVVDTFFDGSVGRAMANYLANPRARVSKDDLDRLSRLIAEARKRRGDA